ncbi:MAG: cytochrome c oxidase subunit II [Caldilineaceae bacterium]
MVERSELERHCFGSITLFLPKPVASSAFTGRAENHTHQRDKRISTRPHWTVFVLLALLMTSGCGDAPAVLDPQGPAATEISRLSWILIGLGTLVYFGVCALLLVALLRRRRTSHKVTDDDRRAGHNFVLWGGLIMPTVVLLVIFGLTLRTLMALSASPRPAELTIEVVGQQWWWEVIYPDHNIVTANEIHIPVGQPVRINLRAAGVVHSFWVPQLHGKLDMIPGRTNSFSIQADSAGDYRGLCAEFCGIQHARMLFLVIAKPPAEFEQWLTQQQQMASPPTTASAQQGQAFFLETACAQCHAIAGTPAQGRLGPDLTHFASRREIGAGTYENTQPPGRLDC